MLFHHALRYPCPLLRIRISIVALLCDLSVSAPPTSLCFSLNIAVYRWRFLFSLAIPVSLWQSLLDWPSFYVEFSS